MSRIAILWDAFHQAFDSLVRTYSPLAVSSAVAFLVSANVEVTPEVKNFLGLGVATGFFVAWYGLNRVWEIATGKVSKLLTLGLVKTKPSAYVAPEKPHAPRSAQIAEERAEQRRLDVGE